MYECLNRPLADEVLRTLVLAKAVDQLNLTLGHSAIYPYIVQPVVGAGSNSAEVPIGWIWGLQLALPSQWEQPRLARIQRIAGSNGVTTGYTGYLRLIFSAVQQGSSTEVSIFYVDYQIDSVLSYQMRRLQVATTAVIANAIDPDQVATVSGFITFKTLDTSDALNATFLNLLAPPTVPLDANHDGYFDNPTTYDVADTIPGGSAVTDDLSTSAITHGTGLLSEDAWTSIPQLSASTQAWIDSFNYPFDQSANRISTSGITIPLGLFSEFNICAPAGDEPTNDTTGTYFPVFISRVEQTAVNLLRFYFSTHNVTDKETGAAGPSLSTIEFATLDLPRTGVPGQVVAIVPISNLQLQYGTDSASWNQHFGRGHVVLSSLWNNSTSDLTDFYAAMAAIIDNPQDTAFTQSSTRIGAFGVSRVPKYTPTVGQGRALLGSTSRRVVPIDPSESNRYVTEQDQGLGDQIDLEALPGITPDPAIDRYGFTGSLAHRMISLVIDNTQVGTDPNYYQNAVLPRLTALLGRPPIFGDIWYTGVRYAYYNGDTWVQP